MWNKKQIIEEIRVLMKARDTFVVETVEHKTHTFAIQELRKVLE